jgi:hypothetical protein
MDRAKLVGPVVRIDVHEQLDVHPDHSVQFHTRPVAARRHNDKEVREYKCATQNPAVFARAPAELEYEVAFGHRNMPICEKHSEPGYQQHYLDGTLLPHQVIGIRWWPKARAQASALPNGQVHMQVENVGADANRLLRVSGRLRNCSGNLRFIDADRSGVVVSD